MNYSVKNVKTFIGNEGQGFNANLYKDSKKVAFVYDDASGGPVNYQFINDDERSIFDEFNAMLGNGQYGEDIYVNQLVDIFLNLKDAKKLVRKASFFVPSKKEIRSFTVKYEGNEEMVRDYLTTNHKNDHVILNKVHISQVVGFIRQTHLSNS